MKPICQICGHEITGKVYYWDDDPRLSMHPNMKQCRTSNIDPTFNVDLAFRDFMNRNVDFINKRGELVLIDQLA